MVAGRHVLAGYLNDSAAERATKIHDGERVWHRTGDAGYFGAEGRLWLCHPDEDRVASWRPLSDGARLVHSTRLRRMRHGPERLAAQLAASGVEAVNLHYTDWTGGLTTLFHRFERFAFGWDAQHERVLRELLRMGVDGFYSNWVDRMVDVLGARGG